MWKYEQKNKVLAQKNRRRKNATRQEGVLWHCYLKRCPIQFNRQYRIDNYIVDFYAPSIKLAIELDGGQHYTEEKKLYDAQRTEVLEKQGVTVLRFTNVDVDRHLRRTVEQIVCQIEQMTGKALY